MSCSRDGDVGRVCDHSCASLRGFTAAGTYTPRCKRLAAKRQKLHSAATETDRAAVRISTLVPPAEGCTGVSCAAQPDAQATCSLTGHQIAQILFIAVIQLAVNRHPCLQNMSAPSALTVLIQGAIMHNNPDYSFNFIRRVILNTVMMLLEQLNSQRL